MASVTVSGIQKRFGSVEVIRDLDLAIADGEFVTLVGPSGCGKSTLLRMIAGLEHPSAGDLFIGGERVNDVPPMHRDVAMVFQTYALYPHLTVRQNIEFGLKLRGVPAADRAVQVQRAAETLNLGQLLDRFPRQLSGGQRQRVAMGRAIVRSPRVFLFDEPLSNLDAQLRVQMRTEIRMLHDRLGSTSVYVTHDQIEAMTMADRIVVMNAGRIEQAGTPNELYDRPANRFVAGFIGSPSMNFFDSSRLEGAAVRLPDGSMLPLQHPLPAAQGRPVCVGVRPEHLDLVASDSPGAVPATVASVEPTGADTHVVVAVGSALATVNLRERFDGRKGDRLWLRASPQHLHLFDAGDGSSLSPAQPTGA
jgi:multiple sugar transport system ATP-binding protein